MAVISAVACTENPLPKMPLRTTRNHAFSASALLHNSSEWIVFTGSECHYLFSCLTIAVKPRMASSRATFSRAIA
jgi:hypothetical protein